MNRLFACVASLLLTPALLPAADTVLTNRVLFIGNSYTGANNLPEIISQIAASKGRVLIHGREVHGGASFEDHCTKFGAEAMIASGGWDAVILQNQSLQPVTDPGAMLTHGRRLCDAADDIGARKILYLTWAYATPHGTMTNLPHGVDPALLPVMQDRLDAAYGQLAYDAAADIAPVGPAFALARQFLPGLRLHTADNSHPTAAGSYLAGLVLYATIFNDAPTGATNVFLIPARGTDNADGVRSVTIEPAQAAALGAAASACVTNDVTGRHVRTHPLANTTVVFPFPSLPQTLQARASDVRDTPCASLYYPRNYETNRAFPVLIHINGGKGGDGRVPHEARIVSRERDFICMNLPLFKDELEPLRPDGSNEWSRLFIKDEDGDVIWAAYSVMLSNLFAAVPNTDRNNVFLGGFSNGGHVTAVLLNRRDLSVTNYATRFFFIEGGMRWTNAAPLARTARVIVLQGGKSGGREWLRRMYSNAVSNGVPAEFHVMRDTDHGFGREGRRMLRTWLYANLDTGTPRAIPASRPAASTNDLRIDAGFPGGNIIVERIDGDHIYVRQDLRDTTGWWFYWNFRVQGAAGRTLTFHFTNRNVIGTRGPAVSFDDGAAWSWLGTDMVHAAAEDPSFTYAFRRRDDCVRFAFAMPYLQADLDRFIARHSGDRHLAVHQLCTTHKGRAAERIHAGNLDGEPAHRVLLTCRHHSCESMASYVLEGILDAVLAPTEDGEWFRANVEVLAIPFADKDGVEDGDQGKHRAPHDHNRDYEGESIHPEVRALRTLVPEWSAGRLCVALDLHCPYINGKNNEHIYLVGSGNQRIWNEQCRFSRILESACEGSVPYRSAGTMGFGSGWNASGNFTPGKGCSRWTSELDGMRMSASLEFPYATAGAVTLTPDIARAFGAHLATAIRRYLE